MHISAVGHVQHEVHRRICLREKENLRFIYLEIKILRTGSKVQEHV